MALDTWNWLEVESGIVSVEAATVDRFVPQMVNFELVGGVDFQKGCYPGQEVVARSQYRGTTKRRTLLFDCDVVPVAPGTFRVTNPASPRAPSPTPRPTRSVPAEQRSSRCASPRSPASCAFGRTVPTARRDLPYAVLPKPRRRPERTALRAFVWYRVPRRCVDAARIAVDAMQQSLAQGWLGLQARLRSALTARCRPDETYARAAATRTRMTASAVSSAAIAAAAEARSALIEGERHVEALELAPEL